MADATKALADIAAQTTLLSSLVTFVQSTQATNGDLSKQVEDLKAALAAKDDSAAQEAIDNIDAAVKANNAVIAGLIPAATQNTDTPPAQAQQAADQAAQPAS